MAESRCEECETENGLHQSSCSRWQAALAEVKAVSEERTSHYVSIPPNYEVTAEFMARAFIEHSYERFAKLPMISLLEQIRYLAQTDLPAIERIIHRIDPNYRR